MSSSMWAEGLPGEEQLPRLVPRASEEVSLVSSLAANTKASLCPEEWEDMLLKVREQSSLLAHFTSCPLHSSDPRPEKRGCDMGTVVFCGFTGLGQ